MRRVKLVATLRLVALARGMNGAMDEELTDLALKLANERFVEHVDALVDAAGSDRSGLALAAAELATEGPAQAGSLNQNAYSLLKEAFHEASESREGLGPSRNVA